MIKTPSHIQTSYAQFWVTFHHLVQLRGLWLLCQLEVTVRWKVLKSTHFPSSEEFSSRTVSTGKSCVTKKGFDLSTAVYLLELLQGYIRGLRERYRTFKCQAKEKVVNKPTLILTLSRQNRRWNRRTRWTSTGRIL